MIKKIFLFNLVLAFFILSGIPCAQAVSEQSKVGKESAQKESAQQTEEINSQIQKIADILQSAVDSLSPGKEFIEFVSNIPRKIKMPLEEAIGQLMGISPGTYTYEGIKVIADRANNIRLEGTKASGSSKLTMNYSNGQLALNGTASMNVGKFISSSMNFTITSSLTYTGNGQITLPIIGTTNFSLTGNANDFVGTVTKSITIAGKTQSVTFTVTKGTISGVQNFDLPVLGTTKVDFIGDPSKLKATIQAHEITYAGIRLDAKKIEVDSNGNLAATGDLYLGTYKFANASLTLSSSGQVNFQGTATISVAGLTASVFNLVYDGTKVIARSATGLKLASYNFNSAYIEISSAGAVTLCGATNNIFGVGGVSANFNLKYENLTFYAESTAGVTLGSYYFELAKIKISAGGIPNLEIPQTKSFTIAGITASYALKYEGGVFFAETAAGISLSSYQFAGAKFRIASNGTVTLTGTTSNNLTVAGITTGFTLQYVSGTLYAESTAGVSLGSYAFSNAKLKIASNGTVSLTGTTSNNLTIAGITAGFALKLENGMLSAESTGGISLGSYAFSSAKLSIASNGTVTLAGTTSNNFTIGGLTTSFALKLENATLYAEGAAGISLGGYTWQAAKFKISAGGIPNLDGTLSKTITIAGQSLSFTLKYANGELYAESTGGISLGGYSFSSANFKISSNGTVMLTGNTANSFTIYGLTASFTLMYANSTLSAEGAAGVSLGGYNFPEAKIKISAGGIPSLEGTHSKTFSIGGASVTLTLNNDATSLYAEGIANVSLGSYTFSNARFRVSTTGVTVAASQNFTIAGKGITFNLNFEPLSGKLSATGTFNITIAGNGFNNCTATMSSTGGVSANGSATISVPHPCYPKVWNVCYSNFTATLAYANGEFNYSY
jgi:autotransporter family porin